eukprot:CAMPEP_0183703766 /NCGR_PEP_ID=MMETSP0737-20130205/1383_1 /TAXON_ID=385413 /ORGANISM="Thalassiosira miniscula, Strain CCMP1093" /LENGTH=472 /DNA_ID=CAMNT_0025930563 /DNA_START=59 /DNA_END=1477 /DNA_ORIENTATION=+
MATPNIFPQEQCDASCSESDSSYSVSQSSISRKEDESSFGEEDESSFGGSRSSGCSVDSTERLLIRLEESDDSLTDLTIDCKSMDKETATWISKLLPGNTRVQRLCLLCGKESHHAEVLRRAVSSLEKSASVVSIQIQGADIHREVASWLVPSFAHCPKLRSLEMISCKFPGSELGILFIAMQHNRCIRQLTFRSCRWGDHDTDILSSSLKFMTLHSLSLVDMNISSESWPYLFRHLETCKNLILLDLSKNKIDAHCIHLLAKALKKSNSISSLLMSECRLDDNCIKELSRGLRGYSTLTTLNISHNNRISDRGVACLKDLIKDNSAISELNVDGCGFSKESMNVIEGGLRYNNSYLKNIFSAKTSQTIFGVVDSIEQLDLSEAVEETTRNIVGAVSFDSESSNGRVEDSKEGVSPGEKQMRQQHDLSKRRPKPRTKPIPRDPMPSRKGSVTSNEVNVSKIPEGGQRRTMLL